VSRAWWSDGSGGREVEGEEGGGKKEVGEGLGGGMGMKRKGVVAER